MQVPDETSLQVAVQVDWGGGALEVHLSAILPHGHFVWVVFIGPRPFETQAEALKITLCNRRVQE